MQILKNISYGPSVLDLYLPDAMPAPVLIWFHGGGLDHGSRENIFNWGVAELLASRGIAVASADYRMYPEVGFPTFLEDAAACCAFLEAHGQEWGGFTKRYIGGNSAGGYISMMLYFDRHYLNAVGLDPDGFDGYVFDAGQPTTHFAVLRERGIDPRAIRVDEASPLYFIDRDVAEPMKKPKMLFLAADNDMPCRLEQHGVLLRTMWAFGYSPARVTFKKMAGYGHCKYTHEPVFADIVSEFIG